MSERGNYLLAIVQCPETGECIQKALKELTDEFNTLNSVEIDGKMVVIEIGGDLKFLNQVTGIGGFASTFSCLWCRCPKVDRSDVAKKWFMTDTSKGARTIEEISKCAKLSNNSKTKFNCKSVHIFHSVPICKVIPDTLHLFRRIMDQLVYQLTFYLQHCKRSPKWRVKCSVCQKQDGHNRLTCDKQIQYSLQALTITLFCLVRCCRFICCFT